MRKLTALILCLSLVCCLAGAPAEEEPEYASYALLDTDELPPELGEQKLTDDQIAALNGASPEELRKKLSTFPVEDGYLVLCAGSYSEYIQSQTDWGMNVIEPLQTDDLSGIITFCNSFDLKWGNDKTLSQLLYFDSTEGLVMDWKSPFYVPTDDSHVTTLFSNPEALYPTDPLSLADYWFPEEIGTSSDLDSETCRALSRGTVQELAESIRSVPDLLTYMHYAAFGKYDGDITLPLQDMDWHFNYSPEVTFRKNAGNCGATAGFAEYLLQGDYDEVGIIGLTYQDGMGGHVINYIRQGEKYYVLDFNSWIAEGRTPSGLHFSVADRLVDAARKYMWGVSGIALMYAYQTDFGDAPIGWVGTDVSYIMKDYAQNVQILIENAPYHYEFIEEKEEIRQLIRLRQNAW